MGWQDVGSRSLAAFSAAELRRLVFLRHIVSALVIVVSIVVISMALVCMMDPALRSMSLVLAMGIAICVLVVGFGLWWITGRLLRAEAARAAVEAMLRQTEQRFNVAFDEAALGKKICDLQGRALRVNPAFCRIVGRAAEDVVGRTSDDYTHPEDRDLTATHIRRIVDGDLSGSDYEKRFLRPEGKIVWVRCTLAPIQQGDDVAAMVIVSDITEQKKTQFELRESQERLQLAVSTGKLGVWEFDPVTLALDLSAECKRHLGRRADEDIAYTDLLAAIDADDQVRCRPIIEAAIRDRTDFEVEFRMNFPGDGEHWLHMRGRARYSAEGSPNCVVGVGVDQTDRKKDEERRTLLLEAERSARNNLERVGRMKDEFLATLSHELRTPLNAILGWAQILHGLSPTAEEFEQGIGVIERNARVQAQIIEDLLDMSRIVSGKVRLSMEPIRIEPVIEAAIETVRPSAKTKGLHLTATIEPASGLILADAGRMQQVFWNILSNAIKFTPRGGEVRVHFSQTPDGAQITFSDNGSGIEAGFLPFVFDRFRQGDATNTRKHGGLGIGLSIAKQLVDLHGGTIRVASDTQGGGTTFTLVLPFVSDPVNGAGNGAGTAVFREVGAPPVQRHAQIEGVRILVVDDEPDARHLAQRLMAGANALVTTASSVDDALKRLGEGEYDILLSDIGMPGQDGYDLIRQVREASDQTIAKIPAIAVTAYARFDDRERTREAGYQAHLVKPIEAESLISAVALLTAGVKA